MIAQDEFIVRFAFLTALMVQWLSVVLPRGPFH